MSRQRGLSRVAAILNPPKPVCHTTTKLAPPEPRRPLPEIHAAASRFVVEVLNLAGIPKESPTCTSLLQLIDQVMRQTAKACMPEGSIKCQNSHTPST